MISNRIVGIVGPKGSGKTYLAARMFSRENRAIVYQVVRTNEEYDVWATGVGDDPVSMYRIMHREEQFRLVYKVPDRDLIITKSRRLLYTSAPAIAREAYLEGSMTLYLDEAHLFLDQQVVDPELLKVIFLARNQRLNITWVAQSMEVHRSIRRNTDTFIWFRVWEPGDLAKITERAGQQVAERVANLDRLTVVDGRTKPGQYLVWESHKENNEDATTQDSSTSNRA